MRFNYFDDILFVMSDDFGQDGGLFFFTAKTEEAAEATVRRFVHKFERECGWEKDSINYDWYWLSSLTKPNYILTKDDFHDIWATASTTVRAGTNNNDSLARLVAEIAGIKCGEIEIEETE